MKKTYYFKQWLILGLAIVIACAFSIAMWSTLNGIFLALMIGIVLWVCLRYLYNLYVMRLALLDGSKEIKELSKNTARNIWEILREQNFQFEQIALQKSFIAYQEEMDRLYNKEQQITTCDIEEYINENLLDREAKKHLSDQIPGVLTGLGILGTFIGLALGLQQFDYTDVSTMTSSIQGLIEGIKIAFCTSISGVTLSIGFTAFYKSQMGKAEDALNEFLETFTSYVVPDSEHQRFNQLIYLGQSQADSMSQFAETISIQLAKSLNQFVTPTMERLTGAIDQITVSATANQQENMEKIVNNFVGQLDQLMGNQFQNLGKTIEHLCEWQESTMVELKKVIEEVCHTAKDIKEVNEYSKEIIENMEGYTQKLQNMQVEINGVLEQIVEQNEQMGKHYEEQNRFINDLIIEESAIRTAIIDLEETTLQYVTQINDSLEGHKELVDESGQVLVKVGEVVQTSMEIILEQSKEQSEQITAAAQVVGERIANLLDEQSGHFEKAVADLALQLSQVQESLEEKSNQFDQNIENILVRTFENFDDNLSDICQHLSGTLSSVEKTTERVPSIINLSYESMQKHLNDYLQVVKSMSDQAEHLVNQNQMLLRVVNERV